MKTNLPIQHMRVIIAAMLFMIIFSLNSTAQNNSKSMLKMQDPYEDFINNYPESPVAKYYSLYPENEMAIKALKNAVVLDNKQDQSLINSLEAERLRNENAELLNSLEKLNQLIQQGIDKDRATMMVKRQNDERLRQSLLETQNEERTQSPEVKLFAIPLK